MENDESIRLLKKNKRVGSHSPETLLRICIECRDCKEVWKTMFNAF